MEQQTPSTPDKYSRWTPDQIPMYVQNERTVRVSARSDVMHTAIYALNLCSKFKLPIEFFYIGASAGQQTAKIMGVFRYKIDEAFAGEKTAVFRPNRVRVKLDTEEGNIVDGIYYEAFVVPLSQLNGAK